MSVQCLAMAGTAERCEGESMRWTLCGLSEDPFEI